MFKKHYFWTHTEHFLKHLRKIEELFTVKCLLANSTKHSTRMFIDHILTFYKYYFWTFKKNQNGFGVFFEYYVCSLSIICQCSISIAVSYCYNHFLKHLMNVEDSLIPNIILDCLVNFFLRFMNIIFEHLKTVSEWFWSVHSKLCLKIVLNLLPKPFSGFSWWCL